MIEKKHKNSIGLKIVWGFLLFLFLLTIRIFFASALFSITAPLATSLGNFRDSAFTHTQTAADSVESKSSLLADKQNLENEVAELQIKNLELSAQANALASSTLSELFPHAPNVVIAKVTDKPPFLAFDTLTIDQGTSAGVAVGDTVYIDNNILIGSISMVTASYSQVTLFSAGGHVEPANNVRTGDAVSLTGVGDGNYEMSVPKDFDVVVGDQFVDLSAQQSLIAVVYYVDTSSQNSFKQVSARIPFNILQSQWVSVETQ